jgi:hypothetical protein
LSATAPSIIYKEAVSMIVNENAIVVGNLIQDQTILRSDIIRNQIKSSAIVIGPWQKEFLLRGVIRFTGEIAGSW